MIGSGPNQPDFTGGVPTFFGFAGGNIQSGLLTQYYDNFRLESDAIEILRSPPCMVPVPEPAGFLIVMVGLTYILAIPAWRMRKG
jgi:hypothetical protein